jgi:hypothetical protein
MQVGQADRDEDEQTPTFPLNPPQLHHPSTRALVGRAVENYVTRPHGSYICSFQGAVPESVVSSRSRGGLVRSTKCA